MPAVWSASVFRSKVALGVLVTAAILSGCQGGCNREVQKEPSGPAASGGSTGSTAAAPVVLDLPPGYGPGGADAAHTVDLGGQSGRRPAPSGNAKGPCPPEMVLVAGSFCIDRYEVTLVKRESHDALSPHYPPSRSETVRLFTTWTKQAPRSRMAAGRALAVPFPPDFQLEAPFEYSAASSPEVLPAGYLSRDSADLACQNASKRLCARGEWVRACRGEQDRRFPYGDSYQDGVCNVHRQSHPSRLLHGNSSKNHLDPRLGLVADHTGPLLRRTGDTASCRSEWGADAIFDMVGNLDEWIDEPPGVFVGGFYSRATREGCDAAIDVHAPSYLDYSLGTRCCLDLR